MAKKTIEPTAAAIRKVVDTGTAIIGFQQTMRHLKKGELTKVFLAANCAQAHKQDILHYAHLTGTPVEETTYSNEDLGILCKKHHMIAVLGVKPAHG